MLKSQTALQQSEQFSHPYFWAPLHHRGRRLAAAAVGVGPSGRPLTR
jgi:hypothetical protein